MPSINDARWQEWADKYLSAPLTYPDEKKTQLLMGYFISRREMDEHELQHMREVFEGDFSAQVAKVHADRLGLKLDEEGMQFLCLASDNLGGLVMHLHGARRLQQRLGLESITCEHLFNEIFSRGFHTDETLHALWDEQKLTREDRETLKGSDNYIDHVSA